MKNDHPGSPLWRNCSQTPTRDTSPFHPPYSRDTLVLAWDVSCPSVGVSHLRAPECLRSITPALFGAVYRRFSNFETSPWTTLAPNQSSPARSPFSASHHVLGPPSLTSVPIVWSGFITFADYTGPTRRAIRFPINNAVGPEPSVVREMLEIVGSLFAKRPDAIADADGTTRQ